MASDFQGRHKDYKSYMGKSYAYDAKNDTHIHVSSAAYELLLAAADGNSDARKKVDRLGEYCTKAADCFYDHATIIKLREEYRDVV